MPALDWGGGHSKASDNTRLKSNRFILNRELSERRPFVKRELRLTKVRRSASSRIGINLLSWRHLTVIISKHFTVMDVRTTGLRLGVLDQSLDERGGERRSGECDVPSFPGCLTDLPFWIGGWGSSRSSPPVHSLGGGTPGIRESLVPLSPFLLLLLRGIAVHWLERGVLGKSCDQLRRCPLQGYLLGQSVPPLGAN